MRARWAGREGEDGAVAIVAAITLIALLLSAAMVIDIAWLRTDRVTSKAGADFGATAAASSYDPVVGGTAVDACLAAVDFVEQNLYGTALTGNPACTEAAVFGSPVYACTALTAPRVAVYENDTFMVEIVSPVPDFDETSAIAALGFDLMEGFAQDAPIDGDRCDRFGVRITRQRGFMLGGFAGIPSGQTTQSSVARWRPGGTDPLYASVVILDRQGCGVLRNTGHDNGHLVVTTATITNDEGETEELAGTITIDALPTPGCTGGNNFHDHLIVVQDNSKALIRASGRIFSYALDRGIDPSRVYWDSIVQTDPATTHGLHPRPVAGSLITRKAVDHRFNCLDTYPTNQRWSPAWTGVTSAPIEPCDVDEGPPPYLKNLHDELEQSVLNEITAPGKGWAIYPDWVPGAACRGAAASGTLGSMTDPATDLNLPVGVDPATIDTTRWFIDCPAANGQAFSPGNLRFEGVRYVVSKNQIRVTGGARLSIVGDEDEAAVLFVQDGSITRSANESRLRLINTFGYLEEGVIDFGSNAPPAGDPDCTDSALAYAACWHAPSIDTADACETYTAGLPPGGCFWPLALWTTSADQHTLSGGAFFDVSGTFFTPNARFNMSGTAEQNFTRAQFFTGTLNMTGQAPITLAPNPETNVPIELPGLALIR